MTSVTYNYRLYYDPTTGAALYYSMEDRDGQWIPVTREQYVAARMDVVVRDGALISTRSIRRVLVLEKSSEGIKTSKYDINILLDDGEVDVEYNYWKPREYQLNH